MVLISEKTASRRKGNTVYQDNNSWNEMLHKQIDSSVRFPKEFSSCHKQGLHSELASSPSTSRVSSVLVDNFFLQSGIRSSFLELASNISFAVCLKFTALYVSPKISLCGQNSKNKHTRRSSENLSAMLVVLRVSTNHCSQSLLRPGTT